MSPVLSEHDRSFYTVPRLQEALYYLYQATSQTLSCVPTAVEISYDSCFYSNVANTFLYKGPVGMHHASNFLRSSALKCP